jgi:5'-phosphate synthase pdxT subunit
MSKRIDDDRVTPLGLLDIAIERNAYGRQLNSSTEIVTYQIHSKKKIKLRTTLIRAPKISYIGESIQVLGEFNNTPLAVLSGHHLGLSFHPELDKIDVFHQILFDKSSSFYYKNFDQVYAT